MNSLQGEHSFENAKIARPSRFCMKQLLKDLQTSNAKIKLRTESTQENRKRRSGTSRPKQRRTSTPTRQTEFGPEDKSYRKFEERLKEEPRKSVIRGAHFSSGSFISGQFPLESRESSHTYVMAFPHSFHTFDYEGEGEQPKLLVEVCAPPPVPMLCYYNEFYYAYCYPVV